MREALTCMGVTEESQEKMMSLLAGILHLGDITFKSVERENVEGSVLDDVSRQSLNHFAELFRCDVNAVEAALLERTLLTRYDSMGDHFLTHSIMLSYPPSLLIFS